MNNCSHLPLAESERRTMSLTARIALNRERDEELVLIQRRLAELERGSENDAYSHLGFTYQIFDPTEAEMWEWSAWQGKSGDYGGHIVEPDSIDGMAPTLYDAHMAAKSAIERWTLDEMKRLQGVIDQMAKRDLTQPVPSTEEAVTTVLEWLGERIAASRPARQADEFEAATGQIVIDETGYGVLEYGPFNPCCCRGSEELEFNGWPDVTHFILDTPPSGEGGR